MLILVAAAPAAFSEESPAASLLFPYFEAGANASGRSTLFSVTNVGDGNTIAHVVLWTPYWQPTLAFDVVLASTDVATFNVRDLLDGNIVGTAPLGLPGCGQYASPALTESQKVALWRDHQGASCLGPDKGGLATGIITVDVVGHCSPVTSTAYAEATAASPLAAGYFANGGAGIARNDNVLVGDFHLVDNAENFAQGETAFGLRADAGNHPAGGATFYSIFGSQGADNRAPLSSVLFGRFINGGAFTGGTSLILVRQPPVLQPWTDLSCDRTPWTEAQGDANFVVYDEQARGSLSQRPLLSGTERYDLRDWEELPAFGALAIESADEAQIGGMVLHSASARFGTGFKLQRLGDDGGDAGISAMAGGFHVDFTWSATELEASFTGSCWSGSNPTNDCTPVAWYFGDGSSGNGMGGSHTYDDGGLYPVTFVARNGAGQLAARTHYVKISGDGDGEGEGGDGDFTVAIAALQVPGTLTFLFEGSCFSEGTPAVCGNPHWTFGDGGSSTALDPSHDYPAAGTYNVSFTATDGSTVATATTTVTALPVVGNVEFEVTFTGVQVPGTLGMQYSGLCYANSQPVVCGNPQWTFGDGQNGTGTDPLHTYAAAGTYQVTFTASYGNQSDSQSQSILVNSVPNGPGGALVVTFSSVQVPGTRNMQFNGSCFRDGSPVTCGNPQWTFGDGENGTGTDPLHTYAAAGSYQVTFSATNDGQNDSDTQTVTVTAIPDAQFEVVGTAVQVPGTLRVEFDAACFLDGVATTCESPQWVFGDGGTSTELDPSHLYTAAGDYTVTLTASHGGQSDSHNFGVTVVALPNNPPTISSLICTPNPVLAGLISLCVLAVVDLDDDGLTYQVDVVGGLGICLQHDNDCTTTIVGNVQGGLGIQIPLALATSLTQATSATIRAIVTDEHGGVSQTLTATVDVILNTPPVISVFACVPPILLPGQTGLCSFNLVDLNLGHDVDWKVEIVGGANACLGSGPGCAQMIEGTTDGLLETINFGLRTSGSTTSPVVLRATADDGLATHQVQVSVIVL